MNIPTKAELNGRPLYLVVSDNPDGDGVLVHAMSVDNTGFAAIAAAEHGVIVQAAVVYDGREAGEE